ncbi:hypothetical protein [Sphingobacterium litopenaei]|uniref:Cyclic nucleotide-binding domain-containing protein n=1 Tax=Sphingobacterium litopenaei TaxID=2763500 RepID=A0ABR7YC94_9SPHI|nr:hypothetical protein [Sphingobacterium litopenaei]MBD1428924.1 hypothetical protein [Sphingobacterium litopenaei]
MKSMPTELQLQQLRQHIEKISPIADEEWDDFSSEWCCVRFPMKTIITLHGQVESYLYFVLEGVQRSIMFLQMGVKLILFSRIHSHSRAWLILR